MSFTMVRAAQLASIASFADAISRQSASTSDSARGPAPGSPTSAVSIPRLVHEVEELALPLDRWIDDGRRLQPVPQRLVVEHDLGWAGDCPVVDVPVVDQLVSAWQTSHGRRIVVGGHRGRQRGRNSARRAEEPGVLHLLEVRLHGPDLPFGDESRVDGLGVALEVRRQRRQHDLLERVGGRVVEAGSTPRASRSRRPTTWPVLKIVNRTPFL